MMKSYFSYFLVVVVLLSMGGQVVLSDPEFDLPVARIYQIEANNSRLRPWNRIDTNLETTIENVENLRLDCTASYPVQWFYTGDGIPAYTVSNKYSRNANRGETTSEYVSTILIKPLKEHHTGRYQCTPAEYIDIRTFFYIYVPGDNLFTSTTGRNIILPKNDSKILIPCKVSHPEADVSLEKSEGGALQRIKVKTPDAISYDPKSGFTVDINKIETPEGTYVCTARHGSYVRSVEYRVLSSFANYQADDPSNLQNKCKKPCGENAYCDLVDGAEVCQCLPDFQGEPNVKCLIKCEAHTDCPKTMSCYVDRQCRSPCVHSAHGCGINAKCKVEDHRPVCYCPKEWVGDETIQCFDSVQGVEPAQNNSDKAAETPTTPSSAVKCSSNTDCPDDMTCIRVNAASTSGKECVDPCKSRRCGRNAECRVQERRSSCECLSGFSGDARIQCEPIKLERNPESEEP